MQEVIPGLFVGDFAASQDADQLAKANITAIVSCMKQEYETDKAIHRVAIDDTSATNIIAHFPASNAFIRDVLARKESVLVHCQAGVSRSATLVAAFLMAELDIQVEEAVERVRSVRNQVDPNEFFMHQLEMYERCECEWDPVKWSEQRRFLMGFAQAQIMDGTSPAIVLAYYPSPAPTPKIGSSLKLTPLDPDAVTKALERRKSIDIVSAASSAPMRKRLTARTSAREVPTAATTVPVASVEKIGKKGEVVVTGKRIRCKMCRRELAARDHILVHEPGKGQQAFAPHRRDMASHRAELERRRLDQLELEKQTAASAPSPPVPEQAASSASVGGAATGLAALRIAQPRGAVPGLRIAQPIRAREPFIPPSRASQATPPPTSSADSSNSIPPASPKADTDPSTSSSADLADSSTNLPSTTTTAALATPIPSLSSEPPLLPSHLCSAYFVEPLSWMGPLVESGALAGKIVCPNTKCGVKIGNFDWAGSQCSCGAWVCPGFAIQVARVDEYLPAAADA